MMPVELGALCRRLGYVFQDDSWLNTALTHKSAVLAEPKSAHRSHYQRMEFVGDAVLGLAIAEALFNRYPEADEGALSQWRANLVNRDYLADLAKTIGVPEAMRISAEQNKLQHNVSVLSDMMEALLGAVYFDGGWAACQHTVQLLFADSIDSVAQLGLNKDPKSQLQEYLQARKWPLPQYTLILQTGPQHRPKFVVQAKLPSFHAQGEADMYSAFGEGESRKEAERQAAEKVLVYLQSVDVDLDVLME